MQHELEALRQGLSSRQAAALDAARAEFAAALQSSQTELEAVRRQASEAGLAASRQGAALAAILRTLAVHAGEEGGPGPASSGGGSDAAAAPAPDPAKAVAFVEAVCATMLDVQQAWQLEKAELSQVGCACCAVSCWTLRHARYRKEPPSMCGCRPLAACRRWNRPRRCTRRWRRCWSGSAATTGR